jgi:DNA-binding NarL/FixJ family response regulator
MLDCRIWKKDPQMTPRQPAEHRPESKSKETATGTARLTTIVASVPGIAEQSLRATLESLPSVQVVGTAAGCLSALQMVRDRQADLVVIDSNLPLGDVRVFLQQLKHEGLRTRSLVLAATSDQVRRALAAGADAALRRDASLGQFSAVVAGLHRANPGEAKESDRKMLSEDIEA